MYRHSACVNLDAHGHLGREYATVSRQTRSANDRAAMTGDVPRWSYGCNVYAVRSAIWNGAGTQ